MRISDWSSDVCSSDLARSDQINNSAPFNDINNRICHYSVTPAFTVNGPSSATNLTPPDGVMCKSHQTFPSSPSTLAASNASILASGISNSTVIVGTLSSYSTNASVHSAAKHSVG